MEELKVNSINEEDYAFCSTIEMGKKEHKEFNVVSYSHLSTTCLASVIILILASAEERILLEGEATISLLGSIAILFIATLMLILTHISINTAYKRLVLAQGKESTVHKTYFGNKIVTGSDDGPAVEYDYSAITSIKETNRFYLLTLKYDLYILVNKNIKSNLPNVSFEQYILSKCTGLKRKKIQNVINKKKTCIIYLCLMALVTLFNLITYIV